jgi:hypothetical protein
MNNIQNKSKYNHYLISICLCLNVQFSGYRSKMIRDRKLPSVTRRTINTEIKAETLKQMLIWNLYYGLWI